MRKYLLILGVSFIATFFTSAQSISVTNLDALVTSNPSESLLQAQATVTNTSSSPMDILVRFNEISVGPAGSGHYFCWAVCYNEGSVTNGFQTPANHSLTLDAGASNTNFYSDYLPNNTVGVATYEYCFFDENNPSDETCVQITFDTQNVGIKDVLTSGKSGVSNSYPNPAASDVNINYSLTPGWNQANLVLYGLLGSQVQSVNLNENQGTLNLDVSSLPAGMYFYTLMVDGNAINTKKMLVTK